MLKKILNPKVCAECQLCCVFDRYDVWETPVFTEEIRDMLLEKKPDTKFISKDGGYIFRVEKLEENDLFYCPALDKAKGCILGDNKPFDCRIWPYRIMNVEGRRAITIAPICEELFNRPLSELVGFMKKELADVIFDYANKHPEIVKEYDSMYPILLLEEKK